MCRLQFTYIPNNTIEGGGGVSLVICPLWRGGLDRCPLVWLSVVIYNVIRGVFITAYTGRRPCLYCSTSPLLSLMFCVMTGYPVV